MALSSVYGPQDARPGTVLAGGVAGIAAASTAPGGSYSGMGGDWLDPSDPKAWIVGINVACIAWIFWLRFVYRGAAL